MTPARVSRALRTLLTAAALLSLPESGRCQSTSYVPVDDPAYHDLDALVAAGWIGGVIAGQRPYSRAAFRRWTDEATARMDEDPAVAPRYREALARLQTRFDGGTSPGTGPGGPGDGARLLLRGLRGDVAWASSPPRPVRTQLTSEVDADVNPLLQRNFGRPVVDGWTVGTEAWLEGRWGSRFAAQLRPRVWASHAPGGGARADVGTVDGYLRGLFGNLSVDVGRNGVVRGHAPNAAPVFSGNARGLDQLRLSMERPAHLPWLFRVLGPVSVSALVADMGGATATAGSKLIAFQGSARPHPDLEVGGALLNHQGGGVGREVPLGDRLRDVFFLLRRRPFYWGGPVRVASDKALALDARLSVPSRGITVALEMMTTDDHDLFRSVKQALWHDAAWTGSAQVTGLGAQGRLDLWMQISRVGLLPYTHHEFTGGLALDRRILGSPLGPLGTGLEGGVHWNGATHRLSAWGAWERYAGDTYRNPDDGLSHRFRTADNPDEIRLRAMASWSRGGAPGGMRTTVRGGVERVTRFAWGPTGRTNALLQLQVDRVW